MDLKDIAHLAIELKIAEEDRQICVENKYNKLRDYKAGNRRKMLKRKKNKDKRKNRNTRERIGKQF